jgi:NADPH:quinone reductase and related Zn-dependent oxidoreductases
MPKRIIVTKYGGPEVLKYENYELQKNLPDTQVRIRQTSIGLNYIDTYHRTGIYPLPLDFPFCIGLEAAGVIIEIGKNVKRLKIGDRVAYSFSPPLGAYCEIRDFEYDKLIKLPDFISNDEAA